MRISDWSSVVCSSDLRDAASRHHQRGGGRDVERVVAVPTRAADGDGVFRGVDGDHASAHRARRSGNLAGILSPIGEGDEEFCNRLLRHSAIENGPESGFCLGLFDRVQGIGQDHASVLASMPPNPSKLASMACPCSVAMLSGWNCTPWIGSAHCRTPRPYPPPERPLPFRFSATSPRPPTRTPCPTTPTP